MTVNILVESLHHIQLGVFLFEHFMSVFTCDIQGRFVSLILLQFHVPY